MVYETSITKDAKSKLINASDLANIKDNNAISIDVFRRYLELLEKNQHTMHCKFYGFDVLKDLAPACFAESPEHFA